jgi:4-aminobutyrate aminotransferase-like enzyme/Ser/Thr protein kinase RdoA (MazF antagonist)
MTNQYSGKGENRGDIDSSESVRFLNIVKPEFTSAQALLALTELYGISGELRGLDSERDLNFRVTTADGQNYLLKISNADEPLNIIDFEITALLHLAINAPHLPVPRIQTSLTGDYVCTTIAANGNEHKVRLLSFLPGEVISELPRSSELIASQGKLSAQMALALQGFFHSAAGNRELLWDVREITSLRPIVTTIDDKQTQVFLLNIIDDFLKDIKPELIHLRSQIAHMDLSRYNMVADSQAANEVSGILDFGDMHHGPLVQDIAIAIADVLQPDPTPLLSAQQFLRAYNQQLPLLTQEIDLLYDLVLVYLTAYYLILVSRGESYYASDQAGVLKAITDLHGQGRDQVTALFRQACGQPFPAGIAAGEVAALIAKRKQVMGEPLYVFYQPPLNITHGKGVYLYDHSGKAYLDSYNNVAMLGHCHPHVSQAIARQSHQLNTNTRYICGEIIAYAARLTSLMPAGLSNAFFVNSGSEANDLAWLMAEAYTGNQGAIIVEDAYHGWTKAVGALSPSGKPSAELASHVRTVAVPDHYRNPDMSEAELLDHHAQLIDQAIESLAKAGLKPALCIVDSAFCSNGVLTPPIGFVSTLFDKVRNAGGLCVADEVQSGFGRMGASMWGFSHHQVTPDIVTLGKPMANGYPMGAVVTRPDILAAASEGGALFATFGGNNVAAAAAYALLDVIDQEKLLENSDNIGRYLKSGLEHLSTKHSIIGDVRGSGLMLGVELVSDSHSRKPAPETTEMLLQIMANKGVLLGADGPHGNVIKMRPPLVLNKQQANDLLQRLDEGFSEVIIS